MKKYVGSSSDSVLGHGILLVGTHYMVDQDGITWLSVPTVDGQEWIECFEVMELVDNDLVPIESTATA